MKGGGWIQEEWLPLILPADELLIQATRTYSGDGLVCAAPPEREFDLPSLSLELVLASPEVGL